MSQFVYSAKHKNWALQNYEKYSSYEQFAISFNKQFGVDKSVCAIQQFLTKKVGRKLQTARSFMHYTQAETKWLCKNHGKYDDYRTMTREFNQHFGTRRKEESLKEKCNKQLNLKLRNGSITKYQKGNIKEQLPIGTIRESTNGCRYIKVLDSLYSFQTGYAEPYWLPIQKKVWLDHFGEVPEGKMVIFLDGNRQNIDISNLYCIDRKISAVMASNSWYNDNAELTLTAIKWCELYYATKGKGNDNENYK